MSTITKPTLTSTTLWTSTAVAIKLIIGLVVIKIFALNFGSAGLGQAANYMTLLTVLGVLSGAGILNAVTKFVAEYEQDPQRLQAILGVSSLWIMSVSAILALIGLLFAQPISLFLFQTADYSLTIQLLALLQCLMALGNYFIAILKGQRQAKACAMSSIFSNLVGSICLLLCLWFAGYQGALIGFACIPALIVVPSLIALFKQHWYWHWQWLKPKFDFSISALLSHYMLMTLVTACTMPVVSILLRNQLIDSQGLSAVGLWQGLSRISDAYLQLLTTAFSVYLLPTFAKLSEKSAIQKEAKKALGFIFPLALALALLVFFSRDYLIIVLFSPDFTPMSDLFGWQLVGDLFKVASYVFGYLWLAKAATGRYICAEIVQGVLLFGLSSYGIAQQGVAGATLGYGLCYMIYFGFCWALFKLDYGSKK
ncbi:lipid III flippase WzxE [Lonepinella sp. BR2357]|uniref:lipid III flippase WzxE n=1 Tax=Lonepinella sp. BR2357 TaxID=3434549 RepID=UPI003F6DC4E7